MPPLLDHVKPNIEHLIVENARVENTLFSNILPKEIINIIKATPMRSQILKIKLFENLLKMVIFYIYKKGACANNSQTPRHPEGKLLNNIDGYIFFLASKSLRGN